MRNLMWQNVLTCDLLSVWDFFAYSYVGFAFFKQKFLISWIVEYSLLFHYFSIHLFIVLIFPPKNALFFTNITFYFIRTLKYYLRSNITLWKTNKKRHCNKHERLEYYAPKLYILLNSYFISDKMLTSLLLKFFLKYHQLCRFARFSSWVSFFPSLSRSTLEN